MYTYGPRKATIKKYVLVANEIQNEIIKNNGKLDYGYYKDTVNSKSGTLLGLGIGLGLLTKNGLFNIVYANGSSKAQAIKLTNSIVHISFKSNF